MSLFLHHFAISVPLFALVLLGYALMRWGGWPVTVPEALSRFVFGVALPAMLFRLMSQLSRLPPVDARLLIAFFGGCLLTFGIGRLVAWKVFRMDGSQQSVFALGGVFSNNVFLGLPIAKLTLGDAALPSVSLILVFNALILWTLVTVSIEFARQGALSLQGFGATLRNVLRNPLILAILGGTLFGLSGLALPQIVDLPLRMLGDCAPALALMSLGMGLVEYGWRESARESLAITTIKLVVQPLVVWGLALALELPEMETRTVVLMASISVGVNVYQVARQFRCLESAAAGSMVFSTALAALSTPLFLSLTGS